tara:strand:+ start:4631 stop:4888 length:258 start_codon:yes stop_codon:yes gene_type:complete
MFAKVVKKLWQGKYCSIRDYELEKAIKNGGLSLHYNGKIMTVCLDDLLKLKPSGNAIQSNFKGTYRLVDIKFKPDADNKVQKQLF